MPPQNIDATQSIKSQNQNAESFDVEKDCLKLGRFLSHPEEGEDIVITGKVHNYCFMKNVP